MMDPEDRAAVAAAGRTRWLFLVTGIAWMIISLVVLRFNVTSVATVGVILGLVLLLVGVNEFVALALVEGWRWAHCLLGILFVVGGLWAFIHPIGAFYELAAILGFLLVLKGTFDVIGAVASRDVSPVWGLGLAVGIVEVLVGFWASQQLFAPRAALILIWVGLAAMFRGITEVVLAFTVRHAGKEASLT